jgi:SAM-dependent methyltransferase
VAEPLAGRYRDVLFPSGHHEEVGLQALFDKAATYGVRAPDPATARVLELGCAGGGHLLPMAMEYPDASFVGVDLAIHDPPWLPNLNFFEGDFASVQGQFDYVLAIGVFSWIEDPSVLMAAVKRCLAPGGLAAVTFNVLPGWADWMRARDLMRFHTESFESHQQQIEQAKAILGTLLKTGANPELRRVAEGHHDAWIYHDWIAPYSGPIHLPDFIAQAPGFDVLGDVWNEQVDDCVTGRKVRTALLQRGL